MEYIYKIKNSINDKFYIGKSKNPKQRWRDHVSNVGKKRHPLYDAMDCYGIENFKMVILDECNSENINELEIEWIKKTNAIDGGYNLVEGGTGGDIFSQLSLERQDEIREKHRQNTLKSNPMDDESIREKHKIKVSSIEYRNNMSDIIQDRVENNPESYEKTSKTMKGRLKDPKMLEKWSEVKQGKKNGRWLGYLICIPPDGERIIFETAVEASDELGSKAQNLREHAKNGTTFKRGRYKGWIFKFKQEIPDWALGQTEDN